MFDSLRATHPRTATEQSAYDKWLDENSAREEARRDRVHGAAGIIPDTVWIVLFLTGGVSCSRTCCSSPTAPSWRGRRRC